MAAASLSLVKRMHYSYLDPDQPKRRTHPMPNAPHPPRPTAHPAPRARADALAHWHCPRPFVPLRAWCVVRGAWCVVRPLPPAARCVPAGAGGCPSGAQRTPPQQLPRPSGPSGPRPWARASAYSAVGRLSHDVADSAAAPSVRTRVLRTAHCPRPRCHVGITAHHCM
jgi:hypothetical protein